jgi:superfamily II RNA helicase
MGANTDQLQQNDECVRGLELLRQMAEAAKVMGSEELKDKFEAALGKVKRDIVSFNSLYL